MTDLNSTTPPASPSDVLLGRVLIVLGIVAVLDLAGIIYLASREVSIPDALVATLGAAVTGLAGLLAGRRP
jgi:hypothetical protein